MQLVSKKQTAILYARVSSDEQAKGGSLGAQEREGNVYLQKHGFALAEFFVDVETAKSSGRENFGKMVDWLLRQKGPVVLVVEKTDRLYRNYEDMVIIKKLVQSKAHEVHLYKEGEILNSQTPSHTWLMHYFKVGMAQNYVENLSEEIKKGRKQKLLEGGWPNKAPYGYQQHGGKVTIEPTQAAYVREAFELFSSGLYSLDRLREKLMENGHVFRPNQPVISKGGLSYLLKNPFYISELHAGGEVYTGSHEAIVSKQVWMLAQKAFRKDNKPLKLGPQDFKYAKLLRCHECGGAVVGEYKKGGRYTYYRCCARKKGCSQGYVSEKVLDEHFDAFIHSLALSPEIKADIMQAAEELEQDTRPSEELRRIEAEIKRYRGNLKKALHEKIEGTLDPDLYLELTADYQQALRKLEDKLERLTRQDVDFYKLAGEWVDIPRTLSGLWIEAKNAEKIEILNIVAANFFVEAGKLHYELKEPFSLLGKKALCQEWWKNRDELRNFILLNAPVIRSLSARFAA